MREIRSAGEMSDIGRDRAIDATGLVTDNKAQRNDPFSGLVETTNTFFNMWMIPPVKSGWLVASVVLAVGCASPEPPPPTCSKDDAWFYAEQAVEGVLKNPDDADFHNPYGWKVDNDPKVSGQYIVTGQVTATNSFNAKIKSTFKAVVRCDAGTWYLGKVTME